jgi:peptidyl-prolyl cis-trans isomerase A (cyclophilin A)
MARFTAFLTLACITIAALLSARAQVATPTPGPDADGIVHVVFETEKGNIYMAVDTRRAPITAAGFLHNVDGGLYNDGTFFRSTRRGPASRITIIQADIASAQRRNAAPAFKIETTTMTTITHTTGTLSMPRGNDPDSARGGLSIMVGESHSLDANNETHYLGYATFGHIEGGWDAIHAIHQSPAVARSSGGGRRGRGRRGAADATTSTLAATPTATPTPPPNSLPAPDGLPYDASLNPPIRILKAYRAASGPR